MTSASPRLTLVPRPSHPRVMGTIKVPYLVERKNQDGTSRFYFQPKTGDRKQGWSTVRLHDQYERAIRDPIEAAAACRSVSEIYVAWRNGDPKAGPHRIDSLGRVLADGARKIRRGTSAKRYLPGQIGAMVADYMAHEVFLDNKQSTQDDYRNYLTMFVEEYGDTYWQKLAPGPVRTWLKTHARTRGRSGAHSLYRTCRAFFGKVRLVYDSVDHPGFVPEYANPMKRLDLELPTAVVLVWPREAIQAFVALADKEGDPSIGDTVVMMSWLGVRRQDWLTWPADFFDGPLLAFRQEKTAIPNVLPWSLVPALVERVAAAKARRTADAVTATTFFHDAQGRPWRNAEAFRDRFNELRAKLVTEHPSFATRYYVGLIEGEPLAVPTADLTMRAMRHTCVTLNFDAGVPADLIGAITGHSANEIDDILAHYRAHTADQAADALNIRMAHEAKAKG